MKKSTLITVGVGITFLIMGILIGIVYTKKDVIFKSNEEKTERIMPKEESTSYSDNDLLVINELNNTLDSIEKEANLPNFSDKAKETFITIVDFLFFNGTIKNVTFDKLTTSGKEKILELASKIDMHLENKAPGYKEEISSKTSNAYKKASEIIANGANNLNEFAKEKLGEENYNSIIYAKDELAKFSESTFNLVKNSGSILFSSTKDKLNDWYQNFKSSK